ncbi:MAG TPA: hypothetical protein VF323_10115 [Candidatus Limnocylindrales bacterium]
MTSLQARRSRPRAARGMRAIRLMFTVSVGAVLAACGPAVTGPSSTPAAASATPGVATFVPTREPTPVPTSAFHASPSPAPTPPSKTKTAWGVIWDAVPRSFPTPPAAEPTDTGDPEAASATLAVPRAAAPTAEWYRSALPPAGYSIESINGPYENGGFVIDAVGASPACRVQVSLARSGTTTTVTILFGAACPFRV